MTNPIQTYSDEAMDFLKTYKRKIRNDDRLEEHLDMVKEFGQDYERAYMLLNVFFANSYRSLSFVLGNQWSLEEISYLNDQRRSSFTYNKIRKFINWYSGYQISNRLATRLEPTETSSSDTADIFTDVMQSIMTLQNGYEEISNAFKCCLETGIAWISPWMDYRDDPVNGNVRFHVDEWNAVTWDPFMTKLTLEDCSFVSRRKFLAPDVIASMFPKKRDLIMQLPYGQKDDKFTWMPFARTWSTQRLMNYTEYWRLKWVEKEMLVDMQTGEMREWKGPKERLSMIRKMVPSLEIVKRPVKSVERGIIVEGELLDYTENPDGLNDYPMTPVVCFFNPSYDLWEWKLQGLPWMLISPQTEINKRRSKMIDILDKQLGASWVAKKNAVENPSSLFQTGQGQVVFLKDTAQMTDVSRIENQGVHPSMFQLEDNFQKDMLDSLGVNPEVFGMAENDKIETAGILSKMRQAAGLVAQQGIFDNLRLSQKILGEKTLKLVQENYTPDKIRRLTKKEPTEEFYSKNFLKYNVTVEEGVLTDSQRQQQFVGLVALRNMGVQIPGIDAMLIENSNLHDKKQIAQIMKQNAEQQAQMQQMGMQLELEQQQTAVNTLNAKAESDRALAAERLNKVHLDQALNVERMARADDERASELLNFVKAVKEINGIDIENLAKKVEILKSLTNDGKDNEKSDTTKPI